ncbi:PP2C family protein-serine/threonine phosphatase [Actinoplanes solisilvae]|uniref:PP2C family protein-serine/threonine phosphatase n=1 Tax=Actinoplanes solisilvae TaxID=2486853 RepID=UPI000FD6F1A7|nr:PP2C family protein-serine/threonine phosphatase [Actinoplanes solisilvae]
MATITTGAEVARSLLLLRACEALSATETEADVLAAVSELAGTGLDTGSLNTYISQALERAHRRDATAGVADTLQQAIVSRTPVVEHYEAATCYLPSDRLERVGGEWYDAVAGPGGQLTMVMGEVAGDDVAAAGRMSRLRSMVRAYIVDRSESPSALLRRLDAAGHALGEPVRATAVVAVVEPRADGAHRLRWSNAGHPPPVLLHPDGTVESLGGEDPMLGASRSASRHTTSVPLRPGATVLLHTAGLVHRPGRTVDRCFADLHRRLRSARRTRLEDLLEDAVAHVGAGPGRTVAMLAVRLPAEG